MDVILNSAIRDLFGERIATHSFYQDVGRIRRRICADIGPDACICIEAYWCDLEDDQQGGLICAVAYTGEGQFLEARRYYDDGSALRIGEGEALEVFSSLFGASWCAEPRPEVRNER